MFEAGTRLPRPRSHIEPRFMKPGLELETLIIFSSAPYYKAFYFHGYEADCKRLLFPKCEICFRPTEGDL